MLQSFALYALEERSFYMSIWEVKCPIFILLGIGTNFLIDRFCIIACECNSELKSPLIVFKEWMLTFAADN